MIRSFQNRLFIVTILVGLLAACGGPPADETAAAGPREVPNYTIEDFLDTTALAGASVSPDNTKILVSTDRSGIFNAYAIPVAGGEPVALTQSADDAVWALSYFPDDERFLYTSDQGGNELNHVFVRELDGSVTDLTPGESLKANFAGWAQDDTSFFVATNERDQRFFDVYEIDAETYERTLIYQDETGYQFADISPDRRYLAFNKPNTTYDSDVYLYDRESGEMEHLTPHEGDASWGAQTFSPDGSALYMTTDEGQEFAYLLSHDLGSGERTEVLRTDWDVWYAYFSKHGKYLVVGINNDAKTELRLFEAATMTPVTLPELPEADIAGLTFSRDESLMAFYANASRSPANLYVHRLDDGGEPRQLTRTLSAKIDPENLVDAEVVRFASYDGVEVPGLLYKPHSASPETPVPGLVWVHGGPGGQSRIGYSALIQYLVNHGYAVYAINNRGSTGYGKTFFRMDDQKHGEADLGDCVASKEMLKATGWVDGNKIGIIGGSYGGYMTLAALTLQPEAFDVGVDLFGISNWIRTLENIPPWWESFREALYREMGDPVADRERLERISPLWNADKIVRPLMVLQGANDPRVLKEESDDIVAAAQANGVPVEYVLFEDEGHGFVKKENRIEGYKKILEFLDLHLKGEGVPTAPTVDPKT